MSAPNIATVTNKYKIGKGNLMFNQLVSGIYQGFRPFGNCPAFTITVATTTLEHKNSQGGLSVTDLSVPTEIKRTSKITCDNLDTENQKLFLSADSVVITQVATPVTDFLIPIAIAGRVYQLGATTSNPAGVRNVSSVVVRFKQGESAATRANTTPYAKGAFIVPATPNSHFYVATAGGTSAGSIPTYPTDGSTVTDGTVTWKDLGLIIVAATADVNYNIDSTLALLSVVDGGLIDLANTVVIGLNVDGLNGLGLEVDFTPAANSRNQVKTSSTSQLTGQLKFLADNPYGENQDVLMPSVTLAASGDLPFIGDAVASMDLDVGINELDSNTAAIYLDGRPADFS